MHPIFNGRGYPAHTRGLTPLDDLYFVGLPWLHTWGSGRFSGVARDAAHVVEKIGARLRSHGRTHDEATA
jgi:putative flavoprotein involved in K+ transport